MKQIVKFTTVSNDYSISIYGDFDNISYTSKIFTNSNLIISNNNINHLASRSLTRHWCPLSDSGCNFVGWKQLWAMKPHKHNIFLITKSLKKTQILTEIGRRCF